MGFRDREIERKLIVKGTTRMADVDRYLLKVLKRHKRLIAGKSEDIYWESPEGSRADFVRLRRANKDGAAKLTIKYSDKRNNFNRIERDVEVHPFSTTRRLLEDVFGKPAGYVNKRYIVYVMGAAGGEADSTISLYQIVGDRRVYLEIEAITAAKVDFWTKKVLRALPYRTKRVNQSLYMIFIKNQHLIK